MPIFQDAAVLVDDVHKSFGEVKALQGVSFEAKRGTVLGILGPNGAGKTTTVKVLSTLLRPDRAVRWSRDTTSSRTPPTSAVRS